MKKLKRYQQAGWHPGLRCHISSTALKITRRTSCFAGLLPDFILVTDIRRILHPLMDMPESKEKSEIICKICHCGDSPSDPFMTPCQCTGSMRYIHTSCLVECVRSSNQCGICRYEFKFKKVFKENTPQHIPLSCLVKTLLRSTGRSLLYLFCLAYVGLRILFIASLNSVVMKNCVYDATRYGFFAVFFLGLLLTAVNFFHNYAFGVIYNTMNNSGRMRMNTRRAFDSMAGNTISRAPNDADGSPTNSGLLNDDRQDGANGNNTEDHSISSPVNNLEDSHAEENSSTTSLIGEYDIGVLLSESIFRVPTFQKLWSDFVQAHSLVWFSVLMYILDGLFGIAYENTPSGMGYFLPGSSDGVWAAGAPHCLLTGWRVFRALSTSFSDSRLFVDGFVDGLALRKPFFVLHSYILFIVCVCYVLYILKTSTKGCFFNYVYNCAKFYFSVVTGILYGFFVLGTVVHAATALLVNNGTPVFFMSRPLLSFIVHVAIGFGISRFLRCIKERILSSFRPGLYFNPYRAEQTSQIIEYVLCSSWPRLVYVSALNILFSATITVYIIFVASYFSPPLHVPDDRTAYFYIKLFFMSLTVSIEFGTVLYGFYARIIILLVLLFKMQNFVYNRPIAIPDRRLLEWDVNINTNSKSLAREVRRINSLIRARGDESSDPQHEGDKNGDFAESNTSSTGRPDKVGRAAVSSRDARRHCPGAIESDRKIIQRYRITDRKIEKYFGRSHHGRFSIFYKPRFYLFYKVVIFLACSLFTLGVMISIFGAASLVARALSPENGTLFLFACLCLSRGIALAGKTAAVGICGFSKLSLLYVYTNLLWPVAASVVYFFIFYTSDDMIRISSLFLFFSAFSGVMQFFFTQLVFALPVHEYSFQFLLQKLISTAITKSALVLLYIIYTRMLGFRIMLCLLLSLVVISYVTRFATALVSGQWLEDIKDHYFLETVSVVNYAPEDSETKR